MRRYLALAVLFALAGCSKTVPVPTGTVTSDAVTDDNRNRDFIKVWHYQITPQVQMNVTSTLTPWLEKCTHFSCGIYALQIIYELKQANGNSVFFDCNAVAEKILDRDLVSTVQEACRVADGQAENYWIQNNDPTEFTDSKGYVWRRQPK